MENFDQVQSQESCKQLNKEHNNDNSNSGKNIKDIDKALAGKEELSVIAPLTNKNIKKNAECLIKLRKRTKTIGDKLAKKRQQLHEQESKVHNNNDAIKENKVRVCKALQSMGIKPEFTRKEANRSIIYSGILLNNVLDFGGIILYEGFLKPLYELPRKKLEKLVEGLQELLGKLILNNKDLKSEAENIAQNIDCLKDYALFYSISNVLCTTLETKKDRHILERFGEDNYNLINDILKTGIKQETFEKKRRKDKVEKKSPADMFTKYINTILAEYLGGEQIEKLEKYKCLPVHLDDLESYAMSLVDAGFGRIVEDEIRINRKNNKQAFIPVSCDRETTERDGMILLPVARRYAFEGDIVRAFILNVRNISSNCTTVESLPIRKDGKIISHITGGCLDNSISLTEDDELFEEIDLECSPESECEDPVELLDTSTAIVTENCPKAFVIKIVKQTGLREIVGSINFVNTTKLNSISYYKLKPYDMRVPMVYIPQKLCKNEIGSANKEDICGMLYLARVLETDINGSCIGELVQPVGKVGNLQDEIKAILLHNGLKDIKPYDQKFHEMYEGPMPPLSEEDLKNREDLRKKCVFTIDPLTAKDLDDAVSVEKLNENEYEIGVHISDVSHYLLENSELDNLVKYRATSIYLVNEVIHMLPPALCFRCSLLPGEDKFALSVFWKWHTEREEFSTPRFIRSVINSCTQFAYEHAQKIIDNPTEDFDHNDFPEISNSWTPNDIKWRVLLLHQIAQKLKARRYENGALSINNPKLRFQLDPITGEPLTYEVEDRKEANYLIEEFMLLANQSAAKFIHDRFPDISILRNHAPPLQKSMQALKERLKNLGLEFNITSSKSIYESMQLLSSQASDPKAVEACLNTLLTKPMARAKYYCSEGKTTDADFWHYALSLPIYTHFTSPIRRYPDILVHRLLAAGLDYCPPPQKTTDELHQLAKICNDQKFHAKCAGDESIELFFKRYIKAKQSITLKAVVTDIYKYMLNVVTIETGHSLTIRYKLQRVLVDTSNIPSFILVSEKNSQKPPLKLEMFSTVDINLIIRNEQICGFIALPDIKQRRLKSSSISEQ